MKLALLLVDDDDIYFDLFKGALARSGRADAVSLHRLTDGDQVMDYLRRVSRKERPQLIILDQRMARQDGIETLQELKADPDLRYIPACLMSTSDQAELVRSAYAGGAAFFMTKPGDLEGLRQQIPVLVDFFTLVARVPR